MRRYPLEQRLEDELETLRNERVNVAAYRHENAVATRSAVQRAANEGWTKTRIAEVAGISRQTVHEMLKD